MANKKLEKPKGLTNATPSYKWKEREDYKKENRGWLRKSMNVALMVLDILDERGMSQQDLADKLVVSRQQVSKILKGQENLTMETIFRLESALGIKLGEVLDAENEIVRQESGVLIAQDASITTELEEIINNNGPAKQQMNVTIYEFSKKQKEYRTGYKREFTAGESNYAMAS